MIIKPFAAAILLTICFDCFAQNYELNFNDVLQKNTGLNSKAYIKKTGVGAIPYLYYTLLFINPMLVIEDKKPYFGLTKEMSFGYYPYGRIALEYSYIFREKNTSHLRASYNYDFILEGGDFAAFNLTPGVGYFTDTKNKGIFAQLSFGIIIPAWISAMNPYIKYRHTFIQNKAVDKTDIDDISLGMGFMFYFND
jgi:hypothetical protein